LRHVSSGTATSSKQLVENFEGPTKMRKNYLAIATLLIAAVCSASAQKGDSQLTGSQRASRPAEALVFKPIAADPKNRMAEFTTPEGVRMRAVTDGPDSIHFIPVDQAQMPVDIYLHSPRAVEKLSGGVGASMDLFGGLRGAFASALGHFTGKKVSGCKTTITITIGEDGSIHTTMQIECDRAA
jgi:hypothetical protein